MIRSLLLAAVALAAPAVAQDAPPAPAATPTTAARLSLETPIETIAADPAGKAVLEKHVPGITAHEAYPMFKAMSLRQLAPMSQGRIDDAALTGIEADLAKLP